MRVLFVLPGLHRHDRGAEVAFISIASEMARSGDAVTLIGSGQPRAAAPYRFLRASSIAREYFEGFPRIPPLRSEYIYEESTFIPSLWLRYRPGDYDVTVTCSYPFTNWILRRPRLFGRRPPHVFVTQNGDWPATANQYEYRLFGCDGLVCTNPDFYERNKSRWRCALIPNGVDAGRFQPGPARRTDFGLPTDRTVVLMVSALVPTKQVGLGIRAVSKIPDAHLVVAGDGPLRDAIDASASQLLPGRFTRLTLRPENMPDLYRSADVFLHLALEESFGNVFVEAMACGLPVVGRDSPRLRWIVGDGECLAADDDPAAIAVEIERARRTSAGQWPGRQRRAAAFSWPGIAAQYRAFLNEVIAASLGRG